MTDFNMPPGVSVNDIPGNRPEDLREEAFWQTVYDKFYEKVGENRAQQFLNNEASNLTEFESLLIEFATIVRYTEGQEAFDQGKLEADMEQYEIENAIHEQGLMTEAELSKLGHARREIKKQWKD